MAQSTAMIPMRPGRPRKNTDLSLSDWTERERNAHVLDWRQRADEFGLQAGDETDEAPVLPSDTLLQEDDPEAYEPHDFRAIDESGRTKDELGDEDEDEDEQEADDGQAQAAGTREDLDLVRVYLKHV